jgi:hypothetical protein
LITIETIVLTDVVIDVAKKRRGASLVLWGFLRLAAR